MRALLPAWRRVMPECNHRRRRACLAAGACLLLLLPIVAALTAPWWGTFLIWRPGSTSFVTVPAAGVDPKTYAVTNASALGELVIPRIIHQTWKTEVVPERWAAARQACADLHPGWELRLWTDEDAERLVAVEFPNLAPTFRSYPFNIQRADVIRYVLLYLYGGVYLDLDIECTKPLDFLRAHPFVMPATRPVGFSNDFLAASPQHPFIARLLRALPAWNVWLLTKYPTVMFSTGPMFVSMQANLFRNKRALWVLPDKLYGKYVPTQASLFRHLFGSSWHGEDAKSLIWLVRHPMLILTVVAASALACLWHLWRRCCGGGQRTGGAGSTTAAEQSAAALKMC